MQTKRLELAIQAILGLAHDLGTHDRQQRKEQILTEVTHLAIDTLHRYVLNFEIKDREPDWYLVGLACFFIGSKINSMHFGGAEAIPRFYYQKRVRPLGSRFQGRKLADYKKDVQAVIT